MRLSSTQKFLLFFTPYLILFFITSQNALFWDTVQFAGDHPNWYFSNHFKYLLLPDQYDSGHPPTFGIYIAFIWKLFGRGLLQSHAAMLPFIALIVWQSVRSGVLLFPDKERRAFCTSLLLLTQCVLMAQCTLVSPDIWLIGFFLFTFNGILKRKPWQIMLGVVALGLISNRAMMAAFTLFLFSFSIDLNTSAKGIKKYLSYAFSKVLPFIPGAVIALSYFLYHYIVKGWIGAPKDSPWAAGFEMVAPSRMALNVAILGWRIIDLGNLGTVLLGVFLCTKWLKGKLIFEDKNHHHFAIALLVLVLALFFITALPLALYQGLLTHRYLLPLTSSIVLLTVFLLFHSNFKNKRKWLLLLVLVQLSGHVWVYPQRISQGWEDSLGHLFYYRMRQDFKTFMLEKGIEKEEVATAGIMMQSDYRVDLLTDTTSYKDFEVDSGKYLWYCNVANAMNKSAPYYFKQFEVIKYERKGFVEMVLFKRPETKP